VGLSMDWPFANNRSEGEYEALNSRYRSRVIETENLSRSIVSNVYLNLKRLELSLERIGSATKSVNSLGTALETEREKFKLGDATVVDTIGTEDRLTASLLSLVAARLAYVQSLALLRFETGTLLPGQDGKADMKVREFITLPNFHLPARATVP
jgi:outer membrane protein TolC